jgi:DNA helicase-2/ATP-dependent DNA helicase PcrA
MLRVAGAAPVALEVVRPLLRGLDRDQRRAVTHRDGPLLVLAGPGTGKTEVITRRIAWLIATKRALPSEILALTFTERAADEMQARVDTLVPYGQAETAIHTFHAFGDHLIRDHGHEIGLPPAPRVVSRAEAMVLLRAHLFELGLDRYRPLADPSRFLGALVDLFQRARDEGAGPEEYAAFADELAAGARAALDGAPDDVARAAAAALLDEAEGQQELSRAYAAYQRLLRERSLIDHGDQVALALRLLDEHPAVRAQVGSRFRYVLVDECQDANPTQLELVERVAVAGNVTLVGDDDQAIYGFRGAAADGMLTLSAAFPGIRTIVLRANYRSRAPILAAAQRLITHNDPGRLKARLGLDLPLVARRRGGRRAEIGELVHRTPSEEAMAVAREVAERIRSGLAPRDVCVLVRSNGDAETVRSALALRGVPVATGGRAGLLGWPETRDLLALLRAIAEPSSSVDLYAVAVAPPYGLAGEDMTRLLEDARRRHRPLWETLLELVEQPGILRVAPSTHEAVRRLVADLRRAVDASHHAPASDVLFGWLRSTGRYAALLAAAESGDDAPLRRVARLFGVVRAQAAILPDARLPVIAPHLSALLDAGDDPVEADDPDEDAVSVLTVHAAKGLEFPVVYLLGLVEGRFPARGRPERLPLPVPLRRLPVEDPVLWAEERRLCYVAMTRARDELVLSRPVEDAAGRRHRPSPFLAEALARPPATIDRPDPGVLAELIGETDAAPPVRHRLVRSSSGEPLSVSHSQVEDYLGCPLRYRLRHVLRVPAPPNHALVVGNALHQAVAAHHLAEIRGRPFDEAALLEVFAAHWSSEGFLSRAHEEARFAAGQAALRRFLAGRSEASERRTVAVERPFSVRLGVDTLRGRYDRIDTSPEGDIITDYKSSDVRDQRTADARARESLQLQTYAIAHEAESGSFPAAMELHFLDTGLVGRVAPDPTRLDRARHTIATAADGIRAGRFEARPDAVTCAWCPYRAICPSAKA